MAVLGQRLVRKVCKDCRTPFEPTEAQLGLLNLSPHDLGDKVFYYGRVVPAATTPAIRGEKVFLSSSLFRKPSCVDQRARPHVVLRQKAVELGMVTLREDGLRSIFDGDTSIEEVVKYT